MSNAIDINNEAALELRDAYQKYRNRFFGKETAFSLSKVAPYFGYIDIKITGLQKFCMFSNNDDFVANDYFWNGIDSYEPMSIKLWLALARSSAFIWDVGSYTGLYSLSAAVQNPKAKVYAFEALDTVYSRLLINITANKIANIKANHLAVSNEDGVAEFHIYAGDMVLSTGSSLIDRNKSRDLFQTKRVRMARIDQLVKEMDVARLDLIKIDTEGAEHLLFEGGHDTFKKHTPDIMCEFLEGSKADEIAIMLSRMGYNFFQIDEKNMHIKQADGIVVGSDMSNLNTLITTKSYEQVSQLSTNCV